MSQTPAEHHFTIYLGEDFSKSWRIYDVAATTGAKTQRSLTGYSGSLTVFDVSGGTTILDFGSTSGTALTVTSGTSDDNVLTTANDTATAALTPGTYDYIFKLTVGSSTLRYAVGTVTVAP